MVRVHLKSRFDRRTVVFSLAGIAWACASIVIRLDWGWFWLPPAAIIVVRLTRGRSVRAVAFCIGALAPGITVSSYLLAQPAVDNWWHRQPFDAAGWRRSRESTDVFWPPRLRMVDDLLRRHDMHGWDRRKVIELLGEPDSTRWDRDNQIVYELGPERGFFGIDSEWLVITFTDDARVADYNLARD